MQLKAYLDGERGRAAALARDMKVNRTLLSQWAAGIRPIPARRCVEIETLTLCAVTRQELRTDWIDLWPELAGAITKKKVRRPKSDTCAAAL